MIKNMKSKKTSGKLWNILAVYVTKGHFLKNERERKTDETETDREEVTQGQERWGRWAALAVPRPCACGREQ